MTEIHEQDEFAAYFDRAAPRRKGDARFHDWINGPTIAGSPTQWIQLRIYEPTKRDDSAYRIVGFLFDDRGVWIGSSITPADAIQGVPVTAPSPPLSVPQIRKVLWAKLEQIARGVLLDWAANAEEESTMEIAVTDPAGSIVDWVPLVEGGGEDSPLHHALKQYRAALENPTRPTAGRRREVHDDELARVAEIYTQAVAAGERAPIKAVARTLASQGRYLSPSTVSSRISAARAAGLLTSTNHRQAGGELTERALRILGRNK